MVYDPRDGGFRLRRTTKTARRAERPGTAKTFKSNATQFDTQLYRKRNQTGF